MTIEEIKELIRLVNESGVADLEVERGDSRVRIRRGQPFRQDYVIPVPAAPAVAPMPVGGPPAVAPHSTGSSAKPQTLEEGHELVKSPIVGTYYDSPSPGAAPFVKIGDTVEPGQVLCIIESMKLMNEIESEVAGTVVAKLVENAKPVEYGEALFAVRPR